MEIVQAALQLVAFFITGYYSPLPGQAFYATGSYITECRLNGIGEVNFDGTKPKLGSCAADFPIGTTFIVPGMRKHDLPLVYVVHDRGGGIVGREIDIWCGEGEEGLVKALALTGTYGVKVVK